MMTYWNFYKRRPIIQLSLFTHQMIIDISDNIDHITGLLFEFCERRLFSPNYWTFEKARAERSQHANTLLSLARNGHIDA